MRYREIPLPWRIFIGAIGWLILISVLHYWLNADHGTRRVIQMGYMPVITNLAAPLLDEASENSDDIRFSAMKFASLQRWPRPFAMIRFRPRL